MRRYRPQKSVTERQSKPCNHALIGEGKVYGCTLLKGHEGLHVWEYPGYKVIHRIVNVDNPAELCGFVYQHPEGMDGPKTPCAYAKDHNGDHSNKAEMTAFVNSLYDSPNPTLPDGLKRRDIYLLRRIATYRKPVSHRRLFSGIVSSSDRFQRKAVRLFDAGLLDKMWGKKQVFYSVTPEGHALLKEWEDIAKPPTK